MDIDKLKQIIEAALMVSESPMSKKDLLRLFETDGDGLEPEVLDSALDALKADYEGRGIELAEVASGFRFQARIALADYVNRVFEERPPRYSRALLETLSIIAYRQPVTRADIESIRGVAVSTNIIKQLTDREWIRVAGHRDVPGRPAVYATTEIFLDYFNLTSLSELPQLPEIRDVPDVNSDLFQDGPTADPARLDAIEAGEADGTDTGDGATAGAFDEAPGPDAEASPESGEAEDDTGVSDARDDAAGTDDVRAPVEDGHAPDDEADGAGNVDATAHGDHDDDASDVAPATTGRDESDAANAGGVDTGPGNGFDDVPVAEIVTGADADETDGADDAADGQARDARTAAAGGSADALVARGRGH